MQATRVEVLREAISKIVAIISGRGLQVTQVGMTAFVQYHPKTFKPLLVNVPFLPDNASEDLITAVQGFIDHECAHVLFSDPAVIAAAGKSAVSALHGILEDTFIERQMKGLYKGSRDNLVQTWQFVQDRIVMPGLNAAVARGDLNDIVQHSMVPLMRFWSGQKECEAAIKDVLPLLDRYIKAIGQDLIDQVPLISSSTEAYRLAVAIHNRIEQMIERARQDEAERKRREDEQKAQQQQQQQPPAGSPTPACDSSGTPTPGDDAEEGDEDDAELETTSNRDEADYEAEDEPEDEEEQSGSGGGNSDDEDEQEDESHGQDQDEDEDESEEPQSKGGEAADAGEDEGDDEQPEEDASDEETSKGEASDEDDEEDGDALDDEGEESEDNASDEEGDESTASASSTGPKSAPEPDIEGIEEKEETEEQAPEPDLTKRAEEGASETTASELGSLKDALEKMKDMDSMMNQVIHNAMASTAAGAEYLPLTKDFDVIEEFQPRSSREAQTQALELLKDRVSSHMAPIQRRLERCIAAKSHARHISGYRSGRINSSALHRIVTGDDRLFRRKFVSKTKDAAVSLVVDMSGSMQGTRIDLAMEAAFALSSSLDKLNITHEVIGFTTREVPQKMKDGRTLQQILEEMVPVRVPSRMEPIYMPIFKSFNGRLTTERKQAMASYREIHMHCNTDGESVEYAGRRLAAQKASRKIMIVLSDGQPNGGWGSGYDVVSHLKKVVERLTEAQIETFGIGIQSNAVEHFYPNHVVLQSLEELPNAVLGQLERMLLAGA
jgi:cobalamin biosynthesis protein CobT